MERKGILLAGGRGTRLYPMTSVISKQLLPIHGKPMIYYSLSIIMLAQIKEVAIISTPRDLPMYQALLGDGSHFGMSFTYIEQKEPEGIAQAYLLAEAFLNGASSMLVLGDNILYGDGLGAKLHNAALQNNVSTVFGCKVTDPERYGVITFKNDKPHSIVEKPAQPTSNIALAGVYFLTSQASERAKLLTPSARGELEITSLLEMYLDEEALQVELLGRGFAWLDTGTHNSLSEASEFIRIIESRQNLKVACLEEIAYVLGWIDKSNLENVVAEFGNSDYGQYLKSIIE